MNKPTLKRACAYLIDLMLVLIISSLFTGIEALNPNADKYEETYDKYKTIISNTTDINTITNINEDKILFIIIALNNI